MLLFGMPGASEWIILVVLLIIILSIVRRVIKRKSNLQQTQSQQQQTNLNIHNYSATAELEKLHELKEKGIITQEEFEQQKRKILNH